MSDVRFYEVLVRVLVRANSAEEAAKMGEDLNKLVVHRAEPRVMSVRDVSDQIYGGGSKEPT